MLMTTKELSAELRKFDTEALAEKADVSTKTIYRIRGGHFPSVQTYEKLLAAISKMRALGLEKESA